MEIIKKKKKSSAFGLTGCCDQLIALWDIICWLVWCILEISLQTSTTSWYFWYNADVAFVCKLHITLHFGQISTHGLYSRQFWIKPIFLRLEEKHIIEHYGACNVLCEKTIFAHWHEMTIELLYVLLQFFLQLKCRGSQISASIVCCLCSLLWINWSIVCTLSSLLQCCAFVSIQLQEERKHYPWRTLTPWFMKL